MNAFLISSASIGLLLLISLVAAAIITLKMNKRQNEAMILTLRELAEATGRANENAAKDVRERLKEVAFRLDATNQVLRDSKSSAEAVAQRQLESNNAISSDFKKVLSEQARELKITVEAGNQKQSVLLEEVTKEIRALA